MSIDEQTVARVATLARIRIEPDDLAHYAKDLSAILGMIEQLSEVVDDTGEGVASVIEHPLPMRQDVVNDGNEPERVLSNAPQSDYGCFVVPKVIDQG